MTSAFHSAIGGALDTIRGAAGVTVELQRVTRFEAWPADQYGKMTYVSGQRGGPAIRMPDTGYGGYHCQVILPNIARIYRIEPNGGFTVVLATLANWTPGDTFACEAEGNEILFRQNGNELGSVVDSTWAEGSPGIASAGTGAGSLKLWEAGGLAAGQLSADPFAYSGDIGDRDDWSKLAGSVTADGAGNVTVTDNSRYRWATPPTLTESAEAIAVPAETRFEMPTDFDFVGMLRVRDWLIAADAYGFGAGVVEPAPGDLIRETLEDGGVEVFEVMSPGGREPAWRWSDRQRNTLRVHTKRIATEEGSGS